MQMISNQVDCGMNPQTSLDAALASTAASRAVEAHAP